MAGSKSQSEVMDNEAEITLGLLNAVHDNSDVTQRSMASDLGIALGLANTYLKRCVRKGYIKVQQIPSNRYAYYLTPKGFAEKTRLTAEYLTSSFTFFRRARQQCAEALDACERRNWRRIALAGASDLAEIATLCANETEIEIVAVIDPDSNGARFAGLPIVGDARGCGPVDAIIVTDVNNPQACFDQLSTDWTAERIIAPALLGVSPQKKAATGAAS
jgi:DNA-binding MarR family transcriptional regulator